MFEGHAITLLLFLAISAGHAAIWVRITNYLHGTKPQHGWIEGFRFSTKLIAFGIPFVLFLAYLPFWWRNGAWPTWLNYLFPYFIICFAVGIFIGPMITLEKWWRADAKVQTAKTSTTHNVVKLLGKSPHGEGRRSWMAKLPLNQAYQVEFTQRTLVLPRWPQELDGLRILHLTDTHFWGRPGREFFEKVFELATKQGHDVLMVTGDIVDSPDHYEWMEMLDVLRGNEGSYFILGNHDGRYDSEEIRSRLMKQGFVDLGGKSLEVPLRGTSLILCGNEMPWLRSFPTLPSTKPSSFQLCLSHCPDQWKWGVEAGMDLMLCGHNHGGQIRVPGIGSIFVPSKSGRRFDCGLFQLKQMTLHVSRGISGGHPVRYLCKPEITWLTIHSA